jgi:hypothetical protein
VIGSGTRYFTYSDIAASRRVEFFMATITLAIRKEINGSWGAEAAAPNLESNFDG